MEFWKELHSELKNGHDVILMYVLKSEGSSPGRQGFKMFVSSSDLLQGSIGGGFMEHKLVELCKSTLAQTSTSVPKSTPTFPFTKRQIHQSSVAQDKSGMICSGEQTIAFYELKETHAELINDIIVAHQQHHYGILHIDEQGISFLPNDSMSHKFEGSLGDEKWSLKEDLGYRPELHIVGGGHVALALSKMASQLEFKIITYDDRTDLNTVEQNAFARHVHVSDYETIANHILPGDHYVVLMSFGYRTDKVILKQLIGQSFKYLGMMGSKEKSNNFFRELLEEGADQKAIDQVHSPIGLSIKSETPAEIAVSILAEIIKVKNQA